ncbi:minor structural protein [Bacillus phage Mater]|uniref:Minor structural protein n=1 Tax=Bacillus phage Mater TaxID=1540090 RepID=A0A0A0RNV3_9CAUD|nr:tail protein [Bacillus phage Mater]AIW03319.1 minor structural protein [Bacillus phage Mater]
MTKSATLYTNVASNYKLSIEWSASQDVAKNSSTITAKMYWEADKYGYVNSSTVKDGAIVIDGTTYTFSGSGLADLNPGQKKLLATKSKTITHNNDGTKSFSISGYFDAEVRLSGTQYNRINISSRSYDLEDIPRKSSVSSSLNFTAGDNFNLSISRSSSSFSHIAYIDVQNRDGSWQYIKSLEYSTSETSKNTAFDTTALTRIFTALDGRNSAPVRVNLNTYNGSNNLGYVTATGTVTATQATIGEAVYGQAGAANKWYIDQTMGISITRYNPNFTHTVEITSGSFTKKLTDVTTGATWTPSDDEQKQIYALLGSGGTYVQARIRTYTYYNGVQVRSYVDRTAYFCIRDSANVPIFSASGLKYSDSNSVTKAITGNEAYLIQDNSFLRVTIPSGAHAKPQNGATIANYTVSVNGVSKVVNYSSGDLNIDFGRVSISGNTVATVRARDSRGLSTTVTMPIIGIPYSAPKLGAVVKRRNNFEATIDITTNGTISPLTVAGVQKNKLEGLSSGESALQYRYKEQANGANFTAWKNLTYTASNAAFTGNAATEILDSTKSYVFEVRVTDKLSTFVFSKTVTSGQPQFFLDAKNKSVSVNKFPERANGLEVGGTLYGYGGIEAYGKPFVTELTYTTPAVAGWYRVAYTESTSVGNNNAQFELYAPLSSYHTFTRFEVGTMWGKPAGVSLSQTSHSTFGGPNISKVRVTFNPDSWTGNTAYLEVYQAEARATPITLRMIGGVGWRLMPIVAGGIPSGYTTKEMAFLNGMKYKAQDLIVPSLNKGAQYNDVGGAYHRVSYHKDAGNFVHIHGLIKGLVQGDRIFTLPSDYAPPARLIFNVMQDDYSKLGRIDVWTSGAVTVESTTNTTIGNDKAWMSLSGISFFAAENPQAGI